MQSPPPFATNTTIAAVEKQQRSSGGLLVDLQGLFDQVEVLIRILSSCEAERSFSFSALCRLKTWLQASMSQDRMNNIININRGWISRT